MRWKTVLNNAETNIFRWDMLFLAVPAGSVSRCFVTYSKNWSFWRAQTSVWLLQRLLLFTSKAGAHYKPLKNVWLTPLHAMSVLTLYSPGTKFRSRCYTVLNSPRIYLPNASPTTKREELEKRFFLHFFKHNPFYAKVFLVILLKMRLFYHKQWIQCISNVNKIGIFLQWKYRIIFTSDWYDLYFYFSKTRRVWRFWDWYTFSKGFTRRMLVRNNATHVVTSTSNIMTSLFGLGQRQFARDVYPKAHSIDFLFAVLLRLIC